MNNGGSAGKIARSVGVEVEQTRGVAKGTEEEEREGSAPERRRECIRVVERSLSAQGFEWAASAAGVFSARRGFADAADGVARARRK